jgi:hypothetical protein
MSDVRVRPVRLRPLADAVAAVGRSPLGGRHTGSGTCHGSSRRNHNVDPSRTPALVVGTASERRTRIDGTVLTITCDSRGPVSVSERPACGVDGARVTSPRSRSPVYVRDSAPGAWRCGVCDTRSRRSSRSTVWWRGENVVPVRPGDTERGRPRFRAVCSSSATGVSAGSDIAGNRRRRRRPVCEEPRRGTSRHPYPRVGLGVVVAPGGAVTRRTRGVSAGSAVRRRRPRPAGVARRRSTGVNACLSLR